jgi:hypothetical protein
MARAIDLKFQMAIFPGRHAALLRNGNPWPRHVVINEDWLAWADESAYVLRQMNGDVAIQPTDAKLAVYRPTHDAAGERHYDLIQVGQRRVG